MSRAGRTGAEGRPWVELERPKPPPVADRYRYWDSPPPDLSPRCVYWTSQIEQGWLPNRRISRYGYDSSAGWYGVYIWEYLSVLSPMIAERR